MKKLMSLMLGLSIALGSFAMFAADDTSTDTTKTTAKKKGMKTKKAKTTKDTTKTS